MRKFILMGLTILVLLMMCSCASSNPIARQTSVEQAAKICKAQRAYLYCTGSHPGNRMCWCAET